MMEHVDGVDEVEFSGLIKRGHCHVSGAHGTIMEPKIIGPR